MDQIMTALTSVFTGLQANGVTIIVTAIGIGAVFVGAAFLWGKTKSWVRKM